MNDVPGNTREEGQDQGVRARIIAAAAALVTEGGIAAATTRAVAQAASVQPPAIYRLFGDKDGLMNAVAEEVFKGYVASKSPSDPAGDVVQQLREGFDHYLEFGLAHPAVFIFINALHGSTPSSVMEAALVGLRERVRLIARAGRLKVSEERAVSLIHVVSTGTVMILRSTPPEQRAGLAEAAREGVLSLVLNEKPSRINHAPSGLASALRTHLPSLAQLTPGERLLMDELLQRIASPDK
ncbi:MAG: TetR/AcrR family transcriptional regulator [Rhodospirillales bacterium]|nr:TetR/AcrR family transcriptional regulator [Acetobacter sp.]